MLSGYDLLNPEVLRGQIDGSANLPTNHRSNGLVASLVVTTGASLLVGFQVLNTNASAQYIQVFDALALPADTAVPDSVFTVPGAGNLPVQYLPWRSFNTGIVLCNSSTAGTKTIGAADCFFDVQYI